MDRRFDLIQGSFLCCLSDRDKLLSFTGKILNSTGHLSAEFQGLIILVWEGEGDYSGLVPSGRMMAEWRDGQGFRLKAVPENGLKVEEMDPAGPETAKGVAKNLHALLVGDTKEFWERTMRPQISQSSEEGAQQSQTTKLQGVVKILQFLQPYPGDFQPLLPGPRVDAKGFNPPCGAPLDPCQKPKGLRVILAPPGLSTESRDNLLVKVEPGSQKVKAEVLDEEAAGSEMSRQRFRQLHYREADGPQEVCQSLQELCRQWLKPERHSKEWILELVVLEQFLAMLPQEMGRWVKDREPDSCTQAVSIAEEFLLGQCEEEEKQDWQGMQHFKAVVVNSPEAQTAPTGPLMEIKQESNWDSKALDVEMAFGEEQDGPQNSGEQEQQRPSLGRTERDPSCCPDQGDLTKAQPGNPPVEQQRRKFINSQGRYEELEEETALTKIILQDERLKTCPDCGKGFVWRSQVIEHQRTHTGERPYACSYCGKRFSSKSYVIKHERIHTGEKPYKCAHCERSFSRRDVLVAHQRTHTGEKPYKCSECKRCFRDRSSFYVHKRTHKRETPDRHHHRLWEKA
ncbi:zinc finger and SCAN domain-containing protein 16-like [Rhineura floridana]|uniref:zinc finger and SCAN domain-containing protein 16-like n=1 Tax=Rhineura floridana TaxID=261503 RepID=UPI002AC849A6|nr:zinc finger and SCAN domain-containing protein 16-like [Rhineura floridana]